VTEINDLFVPFEIRLVHKYHDQNLSHRFHRLAQNFDLVAISENLCNLWAKSVLSAFWKTNRGIRLTGRSISGDWH